MPSPEHEFLSDAALQIMQQVSRSGLYTYKEGARKLFDFSCDLAKDWSKAISGQTLWTHNRDGIDKDLRTLLTDEEVSAAVYIARHSTTNKARVGEIVSAYRNSPMRDRLSRLRVFWIPGDFDADDEKARESTYTNLKEEITRDLLLYVTLGGLTADDVIRFATSTRPGYPVVIISHIKSHGFDNMTRMARTLGISTPILKEEIQRLFVSGTLESDYLTGGIYRLSERGHAILDLCARLHDFLDGTLGENSEFEYVAKILGIDYRNVPIDLGGNGVGYRLVGPNTYQFDYENPSAFLLNHVAWAELAGAVDWPAPFFTLPTI
ncbi:hypothetical protein [Streptomyces sp. NPDC006463]|uniref:hypothetical protein n=1 Tax=Streptomyces sp. NPDC006463 TaxID=3364746 RepID=UPI0036D1F2CE